VGNDNLLLTRDGHMWLLTYKIGMACNKLKNRPWKQQQYLVDLLIFEERLLEVWKTFWVLCDHFNISIKDLYSEWSKKYQVNEFRLRTKY
jgi:hypothetical protein